MYHPVRLGEDCFARARLYVTASSYPAVVLNLRQGLFIFYIVYIIILVVFKLLCVTV